MSRVAPRRGLNRLISGKNFKIPAIFRDCTCNGKRASHEGGRYVHRGLWLASAVLNLTTSHHAILWRRGSAALSSAAHEIRQYQHRNAFQVLPVLRHKLRRPPHHLSPPPPSSSSRTYVQNADNVLTCQSPIRRVGSARRDSVVTYASGTRSRSCVRPVSSFFYCAPNNAALLLTRSVYFPWIMCPAVSRAARMYSYHSTKIHLLPRLFNSLLERLFHLAACTRFITHARIAPIKSSRAIRIVRLSSSVSEDLLISSQLYDEFATAIF